MQIFENHKMILKMKWVIFLVIVIATGIPWWITNYHQYTGSILYTITSVIICGIASLILTFITAHKKVKIVFYSCAALMVAFLIKVYIDGREDPTNHNLVPFEMVIIGAVGLLACTIGAIIGTLLQPIFLKKVANN